LGFNLKEKGVYDISCKDILFARQALTSRYPKWVGTFNDLKATVEKEIFK